MNNDKYTTLYFSEENEYDELQDYEISVDTDWLEREVAEEYGYSTIEELVECCDSYQVADIYWLAANTGHLAQICPY